MALSAVEVLCRELVDSGMPVGPPRVVDLADLSPHLFVADHVDRCPAVREAYAHLLGADLLVVASPTFKGTFTGLLKVFVDRLPRGALRGTVAVPLMTAASPLHRHAVDSYLRPLLVALGARTPAPGLSVLEAQFQALDEPLAGWAATAVPALTEAVRHVLLLDRQATFDQREEASV